MANILTATVDAATSSVVALAAGESAVLALSISAEDLGSFPWRVAIEAKAATDVWVPVGWLTRDAAGLTVTAPGDALEVRVRKLSTTVPIGAVAIGGTVQ